MKDLKRVLIVRYTLIIAAVLVAVSLLAIIPLRSFTVSQEKKRLEAEARIFAVDFQRLFTDGARPSEIDRYLEELAGDNPTRLTLIDTEGAIMGDSETDAEEMENHAARPEVAGALRGEVSSSARESRTLGEDYIYAAAPIEVGGEIVGVARVALAEQDVMPVVLQLWWLFLGAFALLLAVVAAVSIWTERTIVGGLRGMREASADLAAGDLDRRVAEPDIRDFSELARDFNLMAEQVRLRVQEAASERGKLEAVLSNISAGVMVTDSDGRVTMINPAAERILGVDRQKAEGNLVIEVFSSRELDTAVSRAAEGESVDEEIELLYPRKMTLHIKSDPVRDADKIVTATVSAIDDVTSLKRLDSIRRDFVANVSHELRTPVASIKALTDSLLDGAVEDRETADRFLQDLDRESNRLSQLIVDLLALSKLEAEEARLNLEDIDLEGLVRECLESKAKLAEEYGVSIESVPPYPRISVPADRRLLMTALNNLLDNAVKYNRRDGRVEVRCSSEDGEVIIEVTDTGIGIPGDKLPRVFERFYRLDKDRSRETGGTGLGLSIVKHIAELHGGSVDVDSREDEGSSFRIHLPVRQGFTRS